MNIDDRGAEEVLGEQMCDGGCQAGLDGGEAGQVGERAGVVGCGGGGEDGGEESEVFGVDG